MRENAVRIRDRLLATVEGEDFRGHSKFDVLTSPLVRAACLGIPFLRLAASVAVSRAPVDLRGPLLVPKRFSTKAATLLARAYLRRGASGDSAKAGELLDAVSRRTRLAVAYVPGKVRACAVNVNAFVMAILARTGDDARARRPALARGPEPAPRYPGSRPGNTYIHAGAGLRDGRPDPLLAWSNDLIALALAERIAAEGERG